jgi:iron(III) transport system substrate-binding protein
MRFKLLILIVFAFILSACSPEGAASNKTLTNDQASLPVTGAVNIYSSRHYDTDLRLYTNFTKQTGIKVNRIEAGADALIERIKSEGEFSPADLLITVDAGVLWRAENAGILAPVSSKLLEQRIPSHFRHPDGYWFGLTKRARIIIYNKAAGKPDNLETYEDLANPVHKGKICMRSSGSIYNISLLASIIANDGSEAADNWVKGVVNNFARKPMSNDTGQIEAVASGQCDISIVNTYYLARYARSTDPVMETIFDSIGVIFPNQNGRGTHVNVSGAGLTTHAPNRENAIKFLEYLTSKDAQNYFAMGNNEYPIIEEAKPSSTVQKLGKFKEDNLNVSALGENQAEAIKIFDRDGWY